MKLQQKYNHTTHLKKAILCCMDYRVATYYALTNIYPEKISLGKKKGTFCLLLKTLLVGQKKCGGCKLSLRLLKERLFTYWLVIVVIITIYIYFKQTMFLCPMLKQ